MSGCWGVQLRPEVRVNRRRSDGAFAFAAVSDRSWKMYRHSDWLAAVVDRCVTRTPLSALASLAPGVPARDLTAAVEALVAGGVLMWVESEDYPEDFDDADRARADIYATQVSTTGAAVRAVQALRRSRVDVVGVGGLGSWVAWQAATSGIGRLDLHDPDIVEARNSAYQPLCSTSDHGRLKVEVVAEKLRVLFPRVRIETHPSRVRGSDPDRLGGSACVLGCGDEPNSEAFGLMLTEACVTAGVPVVVGGGYAGHDGRIGTSHAGPDDPCYRCWVAHARRGHTDSYVDLMPDRHPPNSVGSVTSVVAAHHVHEAVKIITGVGRRELRGTVGDISVDSLSPRWTAFDVDESCPHHAARTRGAA